MSILKAQIAVEKHLETLSPSVPTAYEGVNFEPPSGSLYQRIQYQINSPTDPTFGKYFHRENIQVQIFVCAPLDGTGTGAAIQRAELIRDHFEKGTTLTEAGIRSHVLRTPQITGTIVTSDRLVVPILIPLTVEVYS